MLERHFRSFKTIDRIRALWLGPQIERYVQSLDELHASNGIVRQHVRTLGHFTDFVVGRGAVRLDDLPDHVNAFVEHWVNVHGGGGKSPRNRGLLISHSRVPVEQMLTLALPGFIPSGNRLPSPFLAEAPGFFTFLRNEKGLSPVTIRSHALTLRPFEAYLSETGTLLCELTPRCITEFIDHRGKSLFKSGMHKTAGALRTFLFYLYRQDIVAKDLVPCVPRQRVYRHASIPRAISWADVERLLASVDCRSDLGKRDYAILTLLASYGVRAREVAALCLEDLDWEHDQISIPMRKGGHSTRYPLSTTVGEALIAYLRVRRADINDRQVFLAVKSPFGPLTHTGVSTVATARMRRIGIQIARAGSHTLRHACVQHLTARNSVRPSSVSKVFTCSAR
ncbi:MAG: tyrosine-type recombinase/integrase [bacterium]